MNENNTKTGITLEMTPPETTDSASDFFSKGMLTLVDGSRAFVCTRGIRALIDKHNISDDALGRQTVKLLTHPEPLDYLQVGHIADTKVWIIDDGSVITWLLPDEY